jgi:hypothetical protein
MTTPFKDTVHLLTDGDPVSASETNKPTQDLTQRTQHLKEVLDALEAGQLLRMTNAVLQSGMVVGTPLYLDTDNVFKPALAAIADDTVGGLTAGSGYVFGILLALDTATSGTVALSGRISSITEVQWAAVMEDAVFAPGHYFLSSEDEGKISLEPGPLAIYVGQALPDGTFLAKPAPPVYGSHTHFQFDLVGDPAGTVVDPSVGNPHLVNTPNTAVRGWLPAAAPYFPTIQIPAGAKFGYNIQHPDEAELRASFPPIPLEGVSFDQGGAILDSGTIVVNQFGIWWMTDDYGTAPWPVDYSVSLTAEVVQFWFSRLLFATSNAVVTRLEKHPQSVLDIQYVNASGQPASSGRLLAKVTDVLPNLNDTDEGALGLKSVSAGKHRRGPVVSRIIPGAGVTINAANGTATEGYYGPMTLSVTNSDALQGNADLVDLANARQDSINGIQVITLAAGRTSNPIFNLEVSRLAPPTATLRLKPWLYSSLTGTVPAGVTIDYRIVAPSSTNAALPTSWTSLATLAGRAVVAGQAAEFDVTPDIANVPAGAIVQVRINRLSTDGFTGNLGFLRLGFTLV